MLPQTLVAAERQKRFSIQKATLHDMGGMNYEIIYDERSRVDGFLLKMDIWGFGDYEDALHAFAVLANQLELEIIR